MKRKEIEVNYFVTRKIISPQSGGEPLMLQGEVDCAFQIFLA